MSISQKKRKQDGKIVIEAGKPYRFVKGQKAYNKGIPMSEKQKEKCSKTWFKGKNVIQMDLDGNYIRTWNSMQQAQKELGISKQSIWSCCKGQFRQAGGYKWKYAS